MNSDLQPDPSVIGGVPQAPLAFLPDPARLFADRAKRFAFLAETSRLGPYLKLLGELSALQARLLAEAPPLPLLDPQALEARRAAALPPIDRAALATDPILSETLDLVCARAAALEMPDAARLALEAVAKATAEERFWLLDNLLANEIPEDAAAPHLFAALAVQLHLARLAARLEAGKLIPLGVGRCPCCGGPPATSSILGAQGIENLRYATCATCATRWNEVRVKCLCCGSGKGLTYRSAETTEATVKAECCAECESWVKILHQGKNPSLDPIADDVGSLGLDMMMKETALKRGGFNPFLTGY